MTIKNKTFAMKKVFEIAVLACALVGVQCEETLPPRIEQQSALQISSVISLQGTYEIGQFMEFVIGIENIYRETFQEKVSITGKMEVWLEKNPSIRGFVNISNSDVSPTPNFSGTTLTLEPGGRFFLKLYWYLYLEDGRYLIDLLDYSEGVEREGLINSKPETFVMEAQFKIFNQLGYLKTEKHTLLFTGYKKVPNDDASAGRR